MPKYDNRLVRVPLYRQVGEAIKRQLLDGKAPGEFLPAEAELTKQFSVSLVTVRQALAELSREGLIVTQRGRKAYVAHATPARKHVAVLMETDISAKGLAPYYLTFTQRLRQALDQAGLRSRPYLGFRGLDVHKWGLDCQDLIDDLALDRISGVVRIGSEKDDSTLEMYAKRDIPFLDQRFLDEPRPVSITEALFVNALRYFRERNRTRLAILAWEDPFDVRGNVVAESFTRVASSFGFELEPYWMSFNAKATLQGMGWERFRDLWLAQPDKPDALIVWDGMLFQDCQTAMLNMGVRIPDDLDVAAFRSDAITFDLRYPVYVGCTDLSELARRYSLEMKRLITGGAMDTNWSWPITWGVEGEAAVDLAMGPETEKLMQSPQ